MSFVVDWFVDPLGLWHLPGNMQRLNQSDVSNLGYSTKKSCAFTAQMLIRDQYPWGGTEWAYSTPNGRKPGSVSSTQGHYRLYDRRVGVPDWPSLITSLTGSGLSALKDVTGVALALQRFMR